MNFSPKKLFLVLLGLVILLTALGCKPEAELTADSNTIGKGQSTTLSYKAAGAVLVEIRPDIGVVANLDPDNDDLEVNGTLQVSPKQTTTYTLIATSQDNQTARAETNIEVVEDPPQVNLSASSKRISQGGSTTLTWSSNNVENAYIEPDIGEVSPEGSISVSPKHTRTYQITASGATGSTGEQVTIKVLGEPDPPPDGHFGSQYEEEIPEDATLDSYDQERFSLVTGKVKDINNAPLDNVQVSILNHPEYGTTTTDAQGHFALPVEGGSTLTLNFDKQNYLSAQRKVEVPWNDFAKVEAFQMIKQDTASTTVNFDGDPDKVVTHQSREVSDEFGERNCNMVFSGDNQAYLLDKNGSRVQELDTINVRTTEYSTQESMPAKLPPRTAYTYCAEMNVQGAKRVEFDKPVTSYVDNFLGFKVGEIVPVGSYNRDRGVWIPEKNGVVVRLLDTTGDGDVDALDADGDGQPNDLDENGNIHNEVKGLKNSSEYQPGDTYWRVKITHFSPYDLNWPSAPPPGAACPGVGEGDFDDGDDEDGGDNGENGDDRDDEDCKTTVGSSTEHRSRTFHENLPIPGTDMKLHYVSNRAKNHEIKFNIPVSENKVHEKLLNIKVRIDIAGKTFQKTLPALPNQKIEFVWDGKDWRGKVVEHPVNAHVKVSNIFRRYYYNPNNKWSNYKSLFDQPGIPRTENIYARGNYIISKKYKKEITPSKARADSPIAEGWTISSHHHFNPGDSFTLYKGNGNKLNKLNYLKKFKYGGNATAGNGVGGYEGDGGPIEKASFRFPLGIAVDAHGNKYIADTLNSCIRKVAKNGTVTTIAGASSTIPEYMLDMISAPEDVRQSPIPLPEYSGDNGKAEDASLKLPADITVDDNGNLFIADTGNNCIRKVDNNGIITTVAGQGDVGGYSLTETLQLSTQVSRPVTIVSLIQDLENIGNGTKGANGGYKGDGNLATNAELNTPTGVATDSYGNIFIADTFNHCIRKVDPSGRITTIAGNATNSGYSGDGGPALKAKLNKPSSIAIDQQGNIYIADTLNHCIRKVTPSGIISTIDETKNLLEYPTDVYVKNNGELYIVDRGNKVLRKINSQGKIKNVKWFVNPTRITLDHEGNIYALETGTQNRIMKLSSQDKNADKVLERYLDFPYAFADDNGQAYFMSHSGLHKKTADLTTGTPLYTFNYNQKDQLISITDQFDQQLNINRYADGKPYSITAPDGQTIQLNIDSENHLSSVIYPDGSKYSFTYTQGGLLKSKTEPNNNKYDYTYNDYGRVTNTYDEHGGHWQFERTVLEEGKIRYKVTSGENNIIKYLDNKTSSGKFTSIITGPAGGTTDYFRSSDGLKIEKTSSCGMQRKFFKTQNPKFNYHYTKNMTASTPSGLSKITKRNISYIDTDSDNSFELVNKNTTVNGKTTVRKNNIPSSTRTITTPQGRTTTINYDPDTLRKSSVQVPGLHTENYSYNDQGKLISKRTQDRETTYSYDPNGYLEIITGPRGLSTHFTRDSMGRVTQLERPDGSIVQYSYDDNGNMIMLTNPEDVDHDFDYNKVDKRSAYQTPLSGIYSYEYDTEKKLTRINFPSGKQINRIYDKGRISQIQTPEGDIDYSYTLCGSKVDSITRGGNSISYTYDGKLTTSEKLDGILNKKLSYTYNNDFRISEFTYAGQTESYSYDLDGLLTSAGDFSITRNMQNGLPESVSDGSYTNSRIFNGYGEINSREIDVNGYNLYASDLTRNKNGQIVEKTVTINGDTHTYNYDYDDLGRLTRVTKDGSVVEEYEYDSDNTRTQERNTLRGIDRSLNYDKEDKLLTAGNTQYHYSEDGFLTQKTCSSNSTQYEYSSKGELLKATLPDNTVIEYTYGPKGRRLSKAVNGTISRKYLWEGMTKLLAVYDGNDNLLMRFNYADSRMPASMTKNGQKYYLVYNQVGTLRAVADANGNVVKRLDYDTFGNVIQDSNPAFQVPFRFAGGLYDKHTELIRFGHRDYDPKTGRWTAKDPIFFDGGDINLYGYCLNDPVNEIDPLGIVPPHGPTHQPVLTPGFGGTPGGGGGPPSGFSSTTGRSETDPTLENFNNLINQFEYNSKTGSDILQIFNNKESEKNKEKERKNKYPNPCITP